MKRGKEMKKWEVTGKEEWNGNEKISEAEKLRKEGKEIRIILERRDECGNDYNLRITLLLYFWMTWVRLSILKPGESSPLIRF